MQQSGQQNASFLPSTGRAAARRTPLLVITLLLPLAAVAFLTFRSARVESTLVEENLFRQADALARGFEANSRTGIMHALWQEGVLKTLLEETVSGSGALAVAVVSVDGNIIEYAGQLPVDSWVDHLAGSLPVAGRPSARLLPAGDIYVYRKDLASLYRRPPPPNRMGRMMGRRQFQPPVPEGAWIAIILDAAGPLSIRARNLRTTWLLALLLAAAVSGILGWIFWSQRAREVSLALDQTESYARELVDRMPAGLIIADGQGKIHMVNPSAEVILGDASRQLRGQDLAEIFPRSLLPAERVLEQAGTHIAEGEVTLADGRSTTLSLSATPAPGEEGRQSGIMVLFQDVTELHSLRDRLDQAERLAEVGKLASTVAHEIRNPLSSIRGFAQLMSHRSSGDESSYSRVMVEEVDRLNRIVSGLLSYARAESPTRETCSLRELVDHVTALAEGDSLAKGISLATRIADDVDPGYLDRDMISQALLNLVINAIEASPRDETVTLEVDRSGGFLRFRVSDHGPGVPAGNRDELFGLFYTTKEGGTGLGLSLVSKTAKLHGGRAWLDSGSDGEGTVAWIEIPMEGGEIGS